MPDKPTRRSFFGLAATAPLAAAVLSSDLHAADSRPPAPARRALRTAVSVYTQGHVPSRGDISLEDPKVLRGLATPVVTPDGFIPVAVGVGRNPEMDLHVVVFDAKRMILDVSADAFAHGPLDFWHEPEGEISVLAYFWGRLSCYPDQVAVCIFGEIDVD